MRKSFTFLLSTFVLLCAFGFSSFAATPTVSTLTPTHNNPNVKKATANLVVKFDQDVKFTSSGGTLIVYKGTSTNAIKTIALSPANANVDISGATLTVKHGLTLVEGESYWIGITDGAIENAAGEDFTGLSRDEWNFTIGDETKPVLKAMTPADNSVNVDVNAETLGENFKLVMEFEDANNIEAVEGGRILLYKADGTIIDIVIINADNTSVTGKTATVKISDKAYFDEYTEYYVNVEAGAFRDVSLNQNQFDGISGKTAWSFTSRDYSAPYVSLAEVTDITHDQAILNVTISEAGFVLYKVQLASEDVPEVPGADISEWTKVATNGDNAVSATLNLPADDTDYRVYYLAENQVGTRQTSVSFETFTALDNTAPEIIADSKDQIVVGNVTVGIQLSFNEPVQGGSGNLEIRNLDDDQVAQSVPANDLSFVKEGDVWVMTARFEGLDSEKDYYVYIPDGLVEDVAGNDYVSDYTTSAGWNFKSSDFIVPAIEEVVIEGAPAADNNILVKFTEKVQLIDGVEITSLNNAAQWFPYLALEHNNTAINYTASYSNGIITINPSADLLPAAEYTVKLRANAFEDLSQNPFSSTHKSYTVTTGDFSDATITYLAVADGETVAEEGTQPAIVFSKEARISGTTSEDVTESNLKPLIIFNEENASGAEVAFSVSWNEASQTATLVPDSPLESGATYFISIDHTKIVDVFDGAFADPGNLTFTMIDYEAPEVTASHAGTVEDKEADEPLTLTFSEVVSVAGNPEHVVIFRQDGPDGNPLGFSAAWDIANNLVLVITPSEPLKPGATYYYGLGAGVASDNINWNESTFSTFTFAPVPPAGTELAIAANGYDPAIGASAVKVNSSGNLVARLTFTEPIKANPETPELNNAVLYDSENNVIKSVPVTSSVIEGYTLIITFDDVSGVLISESDYYITLDPGVVVASADDNNKFESGIAAGEWYFTVVVDADNDDDTAPVVTAKSSQFAVQSTAVDVYENIGTVVLTFSENVDANDAVAVIRKADTYQIVGSNVELVAGQQANQLNISFDVSSYNDNQKFIIEIQGGIVKDDAGNTWEGQIGLEDNAWIVGLPDRTPANLIAVDPDINNGELTDVNPEFTLTFDEDVVLTDNFLIETKYRNPNTLLFTEIYELIQRANITVTGNVVKINPERTLMPSTEYTLTVTHESIRDLAGNGYRYDYGGETGVKRVYSMKFKTVDNVAPTATFLPAGGTTNVENTTRTFTIDFDENILLTDGSLIDNFDLDTLVYVRRGTEEVKHTAVISGQNKITITLTGTNDLVYGAQYTYGFAAAFADAAGNPVGARQASFTVEDAPPVPVDYVTFDPDNGIEDEPTVIPVDQVFRLTFPGALHIYSQSLEDNNIPVNSSNLQGVIILEQGNTKIPITATVEEWNPNQTVVAVKPNDNLVSTTNYTLQVEAQKLQIGVGNHLPITIPEWNNYKTVDVIPPVATFYPADSSTVYPSNTMQITFNEEVKVAGTGVIEIRHKHGEIVKTIEASELSVDMNIVTVTSLSDLEPDEYFVYVPDGLITDLSDNAWEGISVEDQWHFFISEEPSAPVIISISPRGENAPVNSSLVITFDRPVTIKDGYIALYDAQGVAIELYRTIDNAEAFDMNEDNTVVTVDIADLAENSVYHVEVPAGTFALLEDDEFINEAVTRTIWTFTTEINEEPRLVSLTPVDNSTNVSLRTVAKMEFHIDVKPGTGMIALRRGTDASVVHWFDVNSEEVVFNGKEVSFNLEGLIEANSTDYYIIVPKGTITNISEVPEAYEGLEQTYSWNFTTQEDGDEPELVTWSPDKVELGDNYPVFVMEFNEDVLLVNQGNLVVTQVGSEEPALVIPLDASMIDGKVVTVSYDENTFGALKYGTEYFVTVDGGLFEDLAENVWQGVTDNTSWTFMTRDLSVTIAAIQGTGKTSPLLNELVKVTGTVTAIAPGEGFFMQDANEAWSGIWVELTNLSGINVGDGIVVEGTVRELSEVTSIIPATFEVIEAPFIVEPVVLESPSKAKAEMYESVLIKIQGARANAANSNGVWSVFYTDPDIVNINRWLYTYAPVEGNYYDVAGIVNGRMSNFRVEPRKETDIRDITLETSIGTEPSISFSVAPNPFSDYIRVDNAERLTRVIITNIGGQRVMDIQYPEKEIRTGHLVNGVYVISLFNEGGMIKSDRIVKR